MRAEHSRYRTAPISLARFCKVRPTERTISDERKKEEAAKTFLSSKVTRRGRRQGVKVPPPQVDPLPRNLASRPSDSLPLSLSFVSSHRHVFPVRPRASGEVAAFPAYASVSRPAPALSRSERAIPIGDRSTIRWQRGEKRAMQKERILGIVSNRILVQMFTPKVTRFVWRYFVTQGVCH